MDLKPELRNILSQHIGRDRAVSAMTLARRFGFSDDRVIRKTIEELIDDDFPVCSVTDEPAGYFFPASVSDARVYSKALQKRAVAIFMRRRHIIRNTARYYEPARQESLL